MDAKTISIIAAAVAVSIGSIGPARGEGRSVAAAMDAIARQPEALVALTPALVARLEALTDTVASDPDVPIEGDVAL